MFFCMVLPNILLVRNIYVPNFPSSKYMATQLRIAIFSDFNKKKQSFNVAILC